MTRLRPGGITTSGGAMRVGRYWIRTNLRRRWTNYVAIVLLVGAIGGLAIGSVAAARRTQTSYNTFLADSNPSDLTLTVYAPNLESKLAKLAHVRFVGVSSYSVNAFPAGKDGAPALPRPLDDGAVTGVGSLRDEYFKEDKVAVVDGRMANPTRADEFMASVAAAKSLGWHVGETIPMYFYTDAQTERPAFLTNKIKPTVSLPMRLVGTIVPNDAVLVDEVDQKPTLLIFTPALTRQVVNNRLHYNDYALQLDRGSRDVSVVEREIIQALPPGTTYSFRVNSVVAADVNRSLEPDSISLGVFGLIAGLAALMIAAGVIARGLQKESEDLEVLRALGGSPSMLAVAGLLGTAGAIVAGAMLAVGVAIVLSPLSPIGPVRSVYPDRGFSLDWSVLGVGFLSLLVLLGAITLVLARGRSRRLTRQGGPSFAPVASRVGRLAADAGLPITAVVGIRFALESRGSRDVAPVRAALLGAVLAVAIVVSTLTFGSSLSTLVSHPPLYGWNWNYAIYGSGGLDVPPQAARLLNSDPYVAAWSGDNFANAQIDGVTVPIMLTSYDAKVSPPILSGHEITGAGQIVLGAATMRQLHKHIGQFVTGGYGSKKDYPVYVPPVKLKIVGTATLPAVGGTLSLHVAMGVGAIIPISIEPPAFQKFLHSKYSALNGRQIVLVRLRSGAPTKLALASLRSVARTANKDLATTPDSGGSSVIVLPVQYPAEIENYRTIGVTPDLLALALALGAIVALGLTLVASVHRRRRDLALLRTLGFTGRQLLAAVAWQASVAGAIGAVVGIPVGIVVGRWLWTLFANNIFAVPRPTVPVVSVLVVALSALVIANVVAALPGRSAAKTSSAQVLRGE